MIPSGSYGVGSHVGNPSSSTLLRCRLEGPATGAEEVGAVVDCLVMVPSMGRESLGVSLEASLGWREVEAARAAEEEGEGVAEVAAAALSLSLFLGCLSRHHHVDHHWDLRSSFSLRRSGITFMFPWASTTQRKPRGGTFICK